MTGQEAWHLVRDSGKRFIGDNCPRLGAAMAYYTALSLSPLLLAVVGIAGLVYGREAARGGIVEQFRDTIGTQAASFVEQMILKSSEPKHGIIATVVALVVLFFGATGVFGELQSALNSVWKVPGKQSSGGVLTMLKERLLSFSLVCGAAFLLLVSLVVSAVLAGIDSHILGWLPGTEWLAQVLSLLVNFALTAALFAMMFKWLPETQLAWKDVWIGAAVTALLFSAGRFLIGLYLGKAAVASTYGAAGSLVVLLVWIYYSTQILLFGAELTFVYAQRFGSGVRAGGQLVEPREASGGGRPGAAVAPA
jgi:membrane protein